MPKRVSRKKRLISTEVQGGDSYVVINMPTVKETRDKQVIMADYQQAVDIAEMAVKSERNAESPNGNLIEAMNRLRKAETLLNDYAMTAIANYVVEWNWVGDDEKPLGQPNDPDVFAQLTMGEINYLTSEIMGLNEKKGKRGR